MSDCFYTDFTIGSHTHELFVAPSNDIARSVFYNPCSYGGGVVHGSYGGTPNYITINGR